MDIKERNFLITGILLMALTVTLFSFTYVPEENEPNQVVLGLDVENFTQLSVDEFREKSEVKGTIMVDVRSKEEFNGGHIDGAINIEIDNFRENISGFPKDRTYFVYSQNNNRSSQALEIMNSLGFKSAVGLDGGINAWKSSNLPVQPSL